MLGISSDGIQSIKDLAKKSYPNECCGLLIGVNTAEKKVMEVRPVRNWNAERSHDRYVIERKEFEKVDKEAVKKGLQIIGVYHSHPDHPAIPSAYDAEHACSWFSYIIVAVENGVPTDVRSWIFNEEKRQFEEEKING